MKITLFTIYYAKLRFKVLFGYHRTPNPLDLKWRRHYWQHRNFAFNHSDKSAGQRSFLRRIHELF